MSMPASTVPSNPRRGFHVPGWVLVVGGVLVVLALGFIVGRAVHRHRVREAFADRGFQIHDGVAHPWFWLIVVLVLVALLVAIAVALVRHFSHPVAPHATTPSAAAPTAPTRSPAEEVLAQRFAAGEIDEAEFRARRDALRS